MSDQVTAGDEVESNSSHGTFSGTIVQKLTSGTDMKCRHVPTSEDHPRFLLEGNESGARVAYRPQSLRKVDIGG